MQHDDLPLLQCRPPVQVIPFPSRFRIGHAAKVARNLSKAKTNIEADTILSKAVEAHCRQMVRAGIANEEIDKQRLAFKLVIRGECERISAAWVPMIEPRMNNAPEGAA
jgi:hypothetical protein